jgi:hypothetical protein
VHSLFVALFGKYFVLGRQLCLNQMMTTFTAGMTITLTPTSPQLSPRSQLPPSPTVLFPTVFANNVFTNPTRTSYNFEQHYQPPIYGNTIEAGPQGFEGLFSLLRVTTGTSRLDLCLCSSIRQKNSDQDHRLSHAGFAHLRGCW